MFRRARLSVKPNVRPGGRGGGCSPSAPAAPEPQRGQVCASLPARQEPQPNSPASPGTAAGPRPEPPPQPEGGQPGSRDERTGGANDDGEARKPADTPLQRRKRISTMPNLAKPRVALPSAQRSVSKTSQKQVPQSFTNGNSSLQKESYPSEKINTESSPKSPILPEKKTPVPQVPQFSPLKKSVSKEPNVGVTALKKDEILQKNTLCPLKERPTQGRPTQEEMSHTKPPLTKDKQKCTDRERILKAQKLREMLKEELKKERMKKWKNRPTVIEGKTPPDHSKMTMRDLIYYLPENNPMKSSLAEEKKTEKTSTQVQMREPEEIRAPDHEDEEAETEPEEGEENDGPLLVPQVKVAEDGTIILDEESLTVEVLRTKGSCVVEENDPIFERGSTTTYSSFRKSFYTKPWSNKETDMFFLAISMVGTDFSLIGQLFPHRARTEIKNKFKREEKANGWRIDKAFKEKRPFDFEFFAQLLEEVLADEKKRKQKATKRQSSKEKKPHKSRKKQKAKVVSEEADNDQDAPQGVRISDAETEVDAGTAEKENEESLSVSEQTEEQIILEPVTTKKKRKKKKKDDSELEVENQAEEGAAPPKPAKGGKSSNKKKNAVSGMNSDNHTECGEELDVLNQENVDETPVLVEQESHSCLQLNDKTEESLLNLASFQDISAGLIETESSEPETPDIISGSQDWQPSKSQASGTRNKKGNGEETSEAKNNEVCDLYKPDEKKSTAGKSHDSKSETMETEKAAAGKPSMRGRLQRPKPNLARASGKTEAAVQEKSEVKISSPEPAEGAEKMCTMEAGEGNAAEITRDVTTGREIKALESESQETEKAVTEKAAMGGCRQRFKPNVVGASGKREAPVQGEGKDKTPQEPERAIEKSTDQGNTPDSTRGETTEKDGKVSETESQSKEISCLQEGGKQSVLKPAPLIRGRMQRPKPNVGRAAGRQAVSTTKKDVEDEKMEVGETVKSLLHCENKSGALLTTSDATGNEDILLCSEISEKEATAGAEKVVSVHVKQHSQEKPLRSESCEQEKESLSVDDLEDGSDFGIGDARSSQQEEEVAVQTTHLLRNQFQRPKSNLGKEVGGGQVPGVDKDISEDSTEKENSLIQCDSKCSMLPDLDKAAKCEVLPSCQPLGKEDPADSQEVFATPISLQSTKKLSGSESGEQNVSLPSADNQEKTSAVAARLHSKHISQGGSKPASLQPAQLVRSRFQKPKPNIGRAVGKKETRATEKDETEKKTEAEQSALQKDESAGIPSTVHKSKGENEAVSSEASGDELLGCEKQTPEGLSPVPEVYQNVLDERSSSQEDKPCAIKPAQLMRSWFQRARPNLGRAYGKKEEPVAEKVTAPVEGETGKAEESPLPHRDSDIHLSPEAEVDLAQKDGSDSCGVTSPKRSIQSEKLCSLEKSFSCNNQRDQRKSCVSTDVESSLPNYSERSSCGEENKPSAIKHAQLVRGHLRRPKPNLVRATRKKEALEERENTTEEKTEARNTEEGLVCGKKSENLTSLLHTSDNLVEVASSSEDSWKKESADSIEAVPPKRSRQSCKFQSSERLSESESQIEQKDDSQLLYAQEKTSDKLIRRQYRRSSEQAGLPKRVSELRTSSASECEVDRCEKGRPRRKIKPNITKGKGLKTAHSKRSGKEHGSSKVTLVTLRASQEEDEDDADEFELDDEDECFSPEDVNKAPVFVPVGLRSPKPIPVQIEETMEELEISVNVPDVPCITTAEYLSHDLNVVVQPVMQRDENLNASQIEVTTHENLETDTGINDGSTEAAMTLLAMGDPMFQLKISTQGRTQVFPDQDELHMVDSLINQPNTEQNTAPSNQSLSSPTNNELVPSEDGNKVILQDQSSGKEASIEKIFKEDAAPSSDNPVPKVNSTPRFARCRLPKPKPNLSRVLGTNRNVHQKSLSPNADVEQFKQVQSEGKALRETIEEQEVDLEWKIRPAQNSSAGLHNFGSGSTDLAETENKTRETWEASVELKTPVISPKAEIFLPGLENDPNQSSTGVLPENKPGTVMHNLHEVQLTQTEAVTQEFQQQHITSTKEISVNGSGNEYPEEAEEQTFILTLVEIPADSREYHDASMSLEQALEPLLPAPILLTPVNTGLANVMGEPSIGSLTTTDDKAVTSLDNCTGTEGLQRASIETLTNLDETSWKRHAIDLEESDTPPAKRTPSTSAEDNLANTYKESSVKSIHAPRKIAGRISEKMKTSKKKKLPTSIFVSKTAERGQSESFQKLGTIPVEESACKCSDELVSGMDHEGKEEANEQESSMDIGESGRLGHVGSTAALSRSPILRVGRRPLGFLSLICKSSNAEPGEGAKGNRQRLQKPLIAASERSLKRPTPSTENSTDTQESCSLPSTSMLTSAECENIGTAAVQVSSEFSETQASYTKQQEKEEEPTRISEYFFSDIFMEVDDSE
ncbi:transcription factor TFIIIB component B'' homolog isoform X2 [Chelonoidis abingdonii]|uniref:transcription factor TFIIIB component B'' homolog isoform X2 n=1 Tax=Chelonoidis abingdonii TaxID=106734 RepID=UPI0013F20D49|nr:transcription factor TFIIIB component B'' homolog isoform X2 [Chelonoidis abingdonii]